MPDVDTRLATALKQAKTAAMRFAFVAKGSGEGRLMLVKKPPVPPKEIAEAKKELGGGQVFQGRCRWENDQYVFELAKEPPGTLANTIRTIIHKEIGQLFKVTCKAAADLAAEEAGALAEAGTHGPVVGVAPSPPQEAVGESAPAAQNDAARFMARLKALLPEIQQAERGASPDSQQIKLQMSEANVFARKQDFARANAVLDRVEGLLKSSPAGAAPAAAPQAAPVPGALSLVKLGKARLEWIAVRSQAARDIARLKAAIELEFKDDPEQQAELAAASKRLDELVTELNEDLGNQLDAVLNARDDGQRHALAQTAQATMARFVHFVDTDEIMAELDGNEVLPDVQITAPLRAKLQAIADGLGRG